MRKAMIKLSAIGLSFIIYLGNASLAQNSNELNIHFSGTQAYAHCVNILEFGPRVSQSEGIKKTQQYIEQELAKSGWRVHKQAFKDSVSVSYLRNLTFTNLVAYYDPEHKIGFQLANKMVSCHYDSKYLPKSKKPFLGANDSAASIGVMLEMAKFLAKHHPELAHTTNFVFFDGEEAFSPHMYYRHHNDKDGLYGSSYFAQYYQETLRQQQPSLINLDLIGDSNYPIFLSKTANTKLKETAWKLYENNKKDYSFTLKKAWLPILDDHIPLHRAGAKVLNIIGDFGQMDYWHHYQDDIHNICVKQLKSIGLFSLHLLNDI